MAAGLQFKYGDYDFSPRPLFSISAEPLKTPDGTGYGIIHTITMNGEIITTGDEVPSGIVGVFDKVEELKDALDADGKLLIISCDDDPILSGYPTVENYNVDPTNDNYTRRAPYTIEFKMPTTIKGPNGDTFNASIFPPYISSCSETWDVEFQDERIPFEWKLKNNVVEKFGYKMAVTHTVEVEARIVYSGEGLHNTPWEDAKTYASTKLGFDNDFFTLTGVLGLPGGNFFSTYDVFNNYRQVSTNKTAGSITVVETFIVTSDVDDVLPNNAVETFDISIGQNDGIATVSINGEIEGLARMGYDGDGFNKEGFYVIADKFSAASGYYDIIKTRLYDRACMAYSGIAGECFDRPLSAIIRSRTVGMNPINGTISYDYQFDTTTSGCITGECILSQNITIDDTLKTDIFASHTILGRAAGPILQDIGTTTVRVRTVNIEIVTLPPVSCDTVEDIYAPIPTGQIDNFIGIISGDLSSTYSQVFVSDNSQNWNFTLGRYTKSVGFTYNDCDV